MAQGVSAAMSRVLHPLVPNTNALVPNTSTGFEYSQYKPFFEAVQAGDWETAKAFHIQRPEAVRVRHPFYGKTALHVAVDAGHVDIVKELASLMEAEDLEIKSILGDRTALAIAAIKGITEIAECMVTKNKKLVSIPDAFNSLPVVDACLHGRWHMARYLYSVTPLEDLMPDKGPHGTTIISNCFASKEFDISWDLIHRCPKLAITRTHLKVAPLETLATHASSFPSGAELNFWQQWVYDRLYIQPPCNNHICVTVQNEENPQANNGRSLIRSGLVERLVSHSEKQKEGLVSKIVEILGIKRIYEMKIVHVYSLAFLKLMCEEINKDSDMQQMSYPTVNSAIFQAVSKGIVEFITHICIENPEFLWSTDAKSRGIFDFAIQCRQEKIYNLIYGISAKDWVANLSDRENNSKLHMVGLLSPSAQAQLNRIPGAALQMQRELQWYKEVETIVPPKVLEYRNFDEHLTPRELFTKNHSELLKEGEKWMKETATSYIVVGALIITIMFAAVITIPGGNGDTGFPTFIDEKLFMLFIISDAISLFSSTTATLTFLGILTSRFAEDDFLKSLPTKMIIGLATLFLAIATMMIAFSAALLIIVRGQSWIVIPTILLSSVPVTLFVWMQFPLLVRITASTYGKGIFNRNVERWL